MEPSHRALPPALKYPGGNRIYFDTNLRIKKNN